MKLIEYIIRTVYFIPLCLLLFVATSCNEDQSKSEKGENKAIISLSLRAASSSINEDKALWEDRVDELRMIVFDAGNGKAVFNQKLFFPNGFEDKSKGVELEPGTYDFYFIANETVYTGDFITALMSIKNKSEFKTDARFIDLSYRPDFIPDEKNKENRFLMSAIYDGIKVNGGGTESNPASLILPTTKVELIRSLAKVEVIFRKKVSGSTIPANTITSVKLSNVASDISVPPIDSYYSSTKVDSKAASLTGLNYGRDSIGSVTFFVPEFLVQENGSDYTSLNINNKTYPIETDLGFSGILLQRRTVPALSKNSVIRNYHYIVNAYINGQGGIQIKAFIQPWHKDEYKFVFQGDQSIILPPILPTDSSIIYPTECGKIEMLDHNEILSKGLQDAYNDVVNYYDPAIGGPVIYKGSAPYYCEKKYGKGWRLINTCELMSFLTLFDKTYRIWASNTNEAANSKIPFYPITFRQDAQQLLEKMSGQDLSRFILTDNGKDPMNDEKLDIIDRYFTPGDIMIKEEDYPNGWPYAAPPMNSGEKWYYSEVVIQVKGFWYPGYYDLSVPGNRDKVLYGEFQRYDYSSTVSRCVRSVE